MSVNGTITTLRAGDYQAQVAAVGASLVSLTHRGRHLVQPFDPATLAEGYQGATLVPWPNRIVGGRYAVGNQVLEVPVNEAATGAALHGLASFQRWEPTDVSGSAGSWLLDLPPVYGYPFDVDCRVDYALDAEDGLRVTVTGTNQGAEPAPYGASTHPYLSCDVRPVDECTLTLPAGSVLLTDERLSPTEQVPVDGLPLDLRGPTLLGDRQVDNAYTDLPEGTWSVDLTHPEAGGVRMTSDARWVQLYSGDKLGRLGAAVEPMTCAPDAFNRELDAVLLAPGESRTVWLTISAL